MMDLKAWRITVLTTGLIAMTTETHGIVTLMARRFGLCVTPVIDADTNVLWSQVSSCPPFQRQSQWFWGLSSAGAHPPIFHHQTSASTARHFRESTTSCLLGDLRLERWVRQEDGLIGNGFALDSELRYQPGNERGTRCDQHRRRSAEARPVREYLPGALVV
jgi:hypothetical protein